MASPPVISLEDYDAIAAAVMETERGRWFLAEFARRNRAADTEAVLDALAAIEARLAERPVHQNAHSAPATEAVDRIAAAADLAESLRKELAASNRQGRLFTWTAERVEEIERELALALSALNPVERRRDHEPTRSPRDPSPDAASAVGVSDDARVAAEERRLAELYEELARPVDVPPEVEPATELAVAAAGDPISPHILNGEIEDDAAPLAERPEILLRGGSQQPQRGALPKAWTPPLLDSLSETEKAMLFA